MEAGAGSPLVFVHGSASDYRTWQAQQDEFSKHFHLFAYSRRYHWPNEQIGEGADYSMAEHVDDLEAFLGAVEATPVHLVGHSYGAFVCLLLAVRAPQLVRSLVLAEPPAITLFVSNTPKPMEILKLLFSRPRTAFEIIKFGAKGFGPATAAVKRDDMEKAMRIFGRAILGADAFRRLSDSRREQVRANLIKAEFLGSGFPPLDLEQLRHIQVPTLLVSGQESPALFHCILDRLKELLPHAERIEIPGASHIMHEDNAPAYNSAVLSFLTREDEESY
jgi:pimeloyl-ACP methyl ester carboxylesterase